MIALKQKRFVVVLQSSSDLTNLWQLPQLTRSTWYKLKMRLYWYWK